MMYYNQYHAKLVIMARDGNKTAYDLITKDMDLIIDEEIIEWFFLCMKPEIYVDSPEHNRLKFLTNKFETSEVLAFEAF